MGTAASAPRSRPISSGQTPTSQPGVPNAIAGSWRDDGTFSGGWRPNPGADETVNVPYDIGGRRLE